MLPYLHSLFDARGHNDLPKIIEISGQSGSGKTTTLIQLGWEYQQMQFAQGCPKSPTVNFVTFQTHGGGDDTVGEDLMDIHVRNYRNVFTIYHPKEKSQIEACGIEPDLLQQLEGIVLIDGINSPDVLTFCINSIGPNVSHLVYIPPNGVRTYLSDTIHCVHPGHCFVDGKLEEDELSTLTGFSKLAREEQLASIHQSHFGEYSHYRREHNALFTAYQYGGDGDANKQKWVVDQMVRQLTEQGYTRFVDSLERDGDPEGEKVYEWDTGKAP